MVIGIDPHRASHHAFAIDDREVELAQLSVRATRTQTKRLLEWAEPFACRTWAVEGADGLGYLLSQQLVAAGERVVDVPARLLAKRNIDIGDRRTQVVCRMLALLVELAPGGIAKEINASDVDGFLACQVGMRPCSAHLRAHPDVIDHR